MANGRVRHWHARTPLAALTRTHGRHPERGAVRTRTADAWSRWQADFSQRTPKHVPDQFLRFDERTPISAIPDSDLHAMNANSGDAINTAGALNPCVGPGGVKRVHATKLNRGATPAVLILNPVVPFFDPYNHDFSNSSAVADCAAGPSFSGGWTALHAATEATEAGPHGKTQPVRGDLAAMRFLLNGRGHHVPPEISFPHVASPQIDVNAAMTKSKYTPLHVAVRAGHAEALALLLKSSALIDVQDSLGRTPIHHAADLGHADCLKGLLNEGGGSQMGLLTIHIYEGSIVTLQNSENLKGLEVWVEIVVEQAPPLVHAPQRTPVQVHTMTLCVGGG